MPDNAMKALGVVASSSPLSTSDLIATGALIVSFVSLGVAYFGYRITKKFQLYEYHPRLDVIEENVSMGKISGGKTYIATSGTAPEDKKDMNIPANAFAYGATIVNKGAKVVPIERIRLDYGANEDANKRIKYVLEGKSHMSPGEQKRISVTIKPSDIEEVMKKYNIIDCHFYFYLKYKDSDGKSIETYRSLGGYTKGGVIFMSSPGDALTE
jgi:hypothetical protein